MALACLAFGPHPSAVSKSGPALHISGRSLDAKGVYAGPVDIYIERWSTDEERDKVAGPMMSKSPGALLAVLEKVRVRAGYVLTPGIQATGLRALGRRAWNIDFAREITTPGGRRIIIVPSKYGYGSQAQPTIPANSPLVFVVDLKKVSGCPCGAWPGAVSPARPARPLTT